MKVNFRMCKEDIRNSLLFLWYNMTYKFPVDLSDQNFKMDNVV